MKTCAILMLVAVSAQAELLVVRGDTLYCYEKIIAATPSESLLRIYAFPQKIEFAGEELAARTLSDSLPLIQRLAEARYSVVWRAVYETAEEVFTDSAGNPHRLGLRSLQVDIETTHSKTSRADVVESAFCDTMTAAADTLVSGPYAGAKRCQRYLKRPAKLFKASSVRSLVRRVHTAHADKATARKAAMARRASRHRAVRKAATQELTR